MREAVLEILRRRPEGRFNSRQIAHHMRLPSARHKDLRQLLKVLVREGKIIEDRGQRYCFRDEHRVVKGVLKLHGEGFGFLIPEQKGRADVFIPRRHVNHAMNGDEVLAESRRNPADGRYEGRVIQVVRRANQTLAGTLRRLGDQHFVDCRGSRIGLEDLYVPKKNLAGAAPGDYVAARIVQYPGPGIMAIGEVTRVIGGEADEASLKEAALIRYNIARKFPEAVHHELERLPAETSDEIPPGREDLRGLPIITIDGVTAKDFDDAVCAVRRGKGYVLWVSIADVAEYVRAGSSLDREAYRRGTSTYLPGECVPMLPEKLSNGLCSLNPHVSRLTLTAEIHYNGNFEFTRARFYRSVIRSHKRATYDEVQAYYDGSDGPSFTSEARKSLDVMKVLAEALMRRTGERGAMSFDLPEPEILFDDAGKVVSIRKRQRFFSHKLIEQFMIAANVAVAQYFTTRGQPLLYRVHDAPDPLKVQDYLAMLVNLGQGRFVPGFNPADFFRKLEGHPMEFFLQTLFLRSLKQAVYSPDNIGHYGLSLKDYAHFTSPIRRYPDLTVHRQLRSLIEASREGVLCLESRELKGRTRRPEGMTLYSYSDLVTIGNAASKRERDAMEAEREVTDLKRVFFIKSRRHERFSGAVTRVAKFGLFVELEPHFVEGLLPVSALKDDYYAYDEKRLRFVGRRTKRILAIGDRLAVRVAEVNEETAQIRLEADLAPAPAPKSPKKKKRSRRR